MGKKNKFPISIFPNVQHKHVFLCFTLFFGIKKYKTYQKFGEKVYKIRENVIKNIKKLKKDNELIIGYGAPAKATTALNFFGINNEINFIV